MVSRYNCIQGDVAWRWIHLKFKVILSKSLVFSMRSFVYYLIYSLSSLITSTPMLWGGKYINVKLIKDSWNAQPQGLNIMQCVKSVYIPMLLGSMDRKELGCFEGGGLRLHLIKKEKTNEELCLFLLAVWYKSYNAYGKEDMIRLY